MVTVAVSDSVKLTLVPQADLAEGGFPIPRCAVFDSVGDSQPLSCVSVHLCPR